MQRVFHDNFFSTLISVGLSFFTLIACKDDTDVILPEDIEKVLVDEQGLLTDEGLKTLEDPNAPNESQDNIDWINTNAYSVRSLTAESYADLQFFQDALKAKRIVQLGESSHGVKEFNNSKVRLVKFLHQEMNFNVVAFESSVFACYETDRRLKKEMISAPAAMKNGIFDVWHTREVLELFRYILHTYQTDRPLKLAGFDVQHINSFGPFARSQLLFDVIASIDSSYAETVYELDSTHYEYRQFINNEFFNYLETQQDKVTKAYYDLVDFLVKNETKIIERYSGPITDYFISLQIAQSIPLDLVQIELFSADPVKSFSERDKGMAENFEILAQKIYPKEKIIVWAHNYHIMHDLEAARTGTVLQGSKSMGSFLLSKFKEELYTIGFFMYTGSAAFNDRTVYEIRPSSSGSLESIFYRTRKKFVFLNIENLEKQKGNKWIYEYTRTLDWGLVPIQLVFDDNYHGIFFIHSVSPPDYL